MKCCFRFLVIVLALFATGNVNAKLVGQAKIDSLLSGLASHHRNDTVKLDYLNSLSLNYQYLNPDEGLKYGLQALDLATELGRTAGVAAANANMGHNYFRKSDFSKALEYYQLALQQYQKADNPKGVARVKNSMGNVYRNMGNYPRSLENYSASLKLYDSLKDTVGIRQATHNMGSYYVDKCDYPKALEWHLKALKMYEDAHEVEGIGRIADNIGTDYLLQKDYAKALEYFNKGIINDDIIGDKESIGHHLYNIGRVYYEQKNYTVAIKFFTEALNKYNEVGSRKGIGNVTAEMGKILVKQKNYIGAISNLFTALKIDEEIDDKKNAAKCLSYLGDAYVAILKDPSALNNAATGAVPGFSERLADSLIPGGKEALSKRAIDFLQSGVAIAREINVPDVLQTCYANLAEVYKLSGEYELAMEYTNSYHAIKDSLFSIENNDKMTQMMLQKDYEKKHYSDSVNAAMSLSMANMKYEQQRYYTYGGIAGIVLLVVFSAFMIRNNRVQKKLNNTIAKLVTEQEATIRMRTQELAESNAQLAYANKKLIELIQYNAHNLREPLARIMGAMTIKEYLPSAEYYDEIWPQMEKAVTDLDNSIKDVVKIADETVGVYG